MDNDEHIPEDVEILNNIEVVLEASVGINRGQYFVRLPKHVSEYLNLEKDDTIEFTINIAPEEKIVIMKKKV
jgi:hypothetical protein